MRSSDSIAANSAATQTRPAAMRARICGSGPTPKGNSMTTSTENGPGIGEPEAEIFADGEGELHRILVTEIGDALPVPLGIVADRRLAPAEPSRRRRRQPGHDPEQARLAAAVGAADDERAAGFEPE